MTKNDDNIIPFPQIEDETEGDNSFYGEMEIIFTPDSNLIDSEPCDSDMIVGHIGYSPDYIFTSDNNWNPNDIIDDGDTISFPDDVDTILSPEENIANMQMQIEHLMETIYDLLHRVSELEGEING